MPCSVLVVDDDPDNRDVLAEYLTFCGFDVVSACCGTDALSIARKVRPQVVLMDLAMPGLDGYETTRRMKADPLTNNAVVCAVTALALPADQQSARDAGCDAVFIKPIDVGLLVAEIERLASRSLLVPRDSRL